ncbi:MAG: alanine racemase C-terminal domain-containing protein, partial [Gemmatimonadota bacterium]
PEATRGQWRLFRKAVADMERGGIDPGPLHAANSAAHLRYPDVRGDLVRPGIFLYGGGGEHGGATPEAVVALRARVLDVRTVPAGHTVSYGATYTTSGRARLATLGIGYGDGLRRELSGRGAALMEGGRAPILGAVCMDLTVVDVTGMSGVRVGSVATLIGEQGGGRIDLGEVADLCDALDYEILTGLTPRLPRQSLLRSRQ